MATRISRADEKRLRRAATPADAESYAAYLRAEGDYRREADAARQAAAAEAVRSAADYGTGAEALAAGGLADDGYAAYLRDAAKQARAERTARIEADRADSAREAVAGYAAYLERMRAEEGDRLVAAAEELSTVDIGNDVERDRIIAAATADKETAELLREVHKTTREASGNGKSSSVTSVLSYIARNNLSRTRAYDYCRLLGYSDARAREIADYAMEARSDNAKELEKLFGN